MKRGYTKTYLKIFIVILILIAIILGVIYLFRNEYDNERFETIKTNMLLIEAKTKIVSEKVNIKEKDAKYIGTKVSDIKDSEGLTFLQDRGLIDLNSKEHIYYVLNKDNLVELGLDTIELKKGFYIIDYKTNEIIYTEGVTNKNGDTLYKLSDMENME